MDFTAFRGMKPFAQFMFSLFVMTVSVVVFLLLSLILAIPIFGWSNMMASLTPSGMNSPEGLILLKYLQVVQSIGLFVFPALVLGWLFHGNFNEYLQLNRTSKFSSYLYIGLAGLLLIPLINYIGEINSHMQFPEFLAGVEDWMRAKEDEAKMLTEKLIKAEGIPGLLFNVFMIAMLPAIGEELLFRGVIQRIFTNMTKNYHWGIWIAAFIFSAIHIQFYGFLPRFILGAMFGYLLVWTGTMWAPILAHFVNNTMGVVSYYLIDKGTISKDIEQWGTGNEQFPLVLFSIACTGILLFLIYRNSNQTKMPANHIDSQAPRID
ncbi:MAG TPA: CPBP family intramembrane metalloprotease domain-containing protein [Prolixibacteraceae bacterium]|jgi:membrane protease YdiL (CAAX protease family)|nr:CPBP family intramembrane metalloprotease domain-containing protein [Prolixibacteraceae bacterium]